MTRFLRPLLHVVLLMLAGFSLSSCGYEAKGETVKLAITENVNAVPGVARANIHVNANTSGTFITGILKDHRIEDGSSAMSVFSPDDAISIGPSDLGYEGAATLNNLRKHFV